MGQLRLDVIQAVLTGRDQGTGDRMASRMEADLIKVFDTGFLQHPLIGAPWFTDGLALTANMLAREHIGITGYSGELLQNIDSQCAQVNDPALAILGQGYEQRLILPVHMFPR